MGDEPPAGCEVCEAGPLERVLYPVAVHFKGSGFYTTDYGRGSRKPAKDGESGERTDSESGGKTDSSSSDAGGAGNSETSSEKKAAEA